MKSLLVVCAAVACTVAASGCTSGDLGTATSPIDPFGTEPGSSGGESTGGNADTIAELCASACVHIQAACPDAEGADCATDCASSAPPGCDTQFRAFVRCVSSAQIYCSGSSIEVPQCQSAVDAVTNCIASTGVPGSGTSGGTGAAGATGTSGTPRGA